MKKPEYWTGAHTKHRLKYHIVFIPKYRKRVLRGEVVQTVKTHPELEEFLWGDSFWADGYFAESVGVHQEEMIKKYIDDQGQ